VATDTLIAGIPILDLTQGMTVKFEAVSPTTGAAITGVVVSAASIYGRDITPGSETDLIPVPTPALVPVAT
jgi:hypothetical protein